MAIMKKAAKVALVIVPAILWIPAALFLSFEGAWLSPVVSKDDSKGFMAFAQKHLEDNLKGNGALVVIENGEVFDSYYQTATLSNNSEEQSVNGDTLFPAASMSKFVAAIAIHTLAQQQHISLEAGVEDYLTSWRLPASDFDHQQVSIARLLSHTAGLTDGLGFGDYRREERLPSVVESLNNPRSSSGEKRIEVGVSPGSEFHYSGGSYLLLELLLEDVTTESYASWVERNVLLPRAMKRTNFAYLGDQYNSTPSFDIDGQPTPLFKYASSAATAMNTSASDLVRLLQSLLDDKPLIDLLSTPMGEAMGAPIWGQGAMLYAPLSTGRFVIGHDGSNDPAINTSIRLNPQTGDGYIALISGHTTIASEIGFEWVLWQSGKPDFIFADKAIDSAMAPAAIGSVGWVFVSIVLLVLRKRAMR